MRIIHRRDFVALRERLTDVDLRALDVVLHHQPQAHDFYLLWEMAENTHAHIVRKRIHQLAASYRPPWP